MQKRLRAGSVENKEGKAGDTNKSTQTHKKAKHHKFLSSKWRCTLKFPTEGGSNWTELETNMKITSASEWIDAQCEEIRRMLKKMQADPVASKDALVTLRRALESSFNKTD